MSDELPAGWVSTSLADVITGLESGSRPRGGVRGITEGVVSVGGEHLRYDGGFDLSSVKYVPKRFADGMTRGRVRTHDILIVKDGATTGKTAFVDPAFPFHEAVVNEHVFICRPGPAVEPRYLFRFLTSTAGQQRILSNFKGSAQGGINQTFAPNTEVPLAPLAEQRRIVAKVEQLLARADACQQRLAKVPALLKRFRQAVLVAAYTGRLTADWREAHPDSGPAQRLRDGLPNRHSDSVSTVNESLTPATWVWVHFGLLIESIRGGATVPPQRERTAYPILRSSSVRTGSIDFGDVRYLNENESSVDENYLRDGDVLFTRLSGSIEYLANCAVVRGIGDRRVQFPDRIFRARLKDGATADFIELWFSVPMLRGELTAGAKSSAGHQRVSITDITRQRLPLPPAEEQREIVRRVGALLALADRIAAGYERARQRVEKLKPSILARAFRGELVPQDPNDEPASELLERVASLQRGLQPTRSR